MNNTYHFDLNSVEKGHHKTTYRGVKSIRCPFDYVLYQMVVEEVRPDLIIEIGTAYGGSALYLADLLQNIGSGMLHTIDIQEEWFLTNSDEKIKLINEHPRIKRFLGGYQQYDLENASSFNKILVIEDGSHRYSDVINAMNKFKDLVSEDSYMIIEDGVLSYLGLERHYNGGPLKAIEEFLPQNPQFYIDRNWCDFYGYNATFNPNGYLKKTKTQNL